MSVVRCMWFGRQAYSIKCTKVSGIDGMRGYFNVILFYFSYEALMPGTRRIRSFSIDNVQTSQRGEDHRFKPILEKVALQSVGDSHSSDEWLIKRKLTIVIC